MFSNWVYFPVISLTGMNLIAIAYEYILGSKRYDK